MDNTAKLKKEIDAYIRNNVNQNTYSENVYSIVKECDDIHFSLKDIPPEETHRKRSNLDSRLSAPRTAFVDKLFEHIEQSGMTDVQVYRKAGISRKLFSKIRSDRYYTHSKRSIVAFVLALELNMDDASNLLMKAGYTFSNSSIFDIIILFCIENEEYDIYKINEVLFEYKQDLIGC